MKKKNLRLLTLLVSIFSIGLVTINVNATTEMPEAVDGVIKLEEDVELTAQFNNGETLTIDLNGHNITKPDGSWYGIHNTGNLTIIDTGATKGEINCSFASVDSGTVTCVHNAGGTLNIEGVKITSSVVGVKNEENSTLNITSSTISNTISDSDHIYGAILNVGTMNINGSTISGRNAGIHIANPSAQTTTIVNNSYISGGNGSIKEDNSNGANTITVTNGTINGGVYKSDGTNISLSGNISVNNNGINAIQYATSGTTVTLNISGNVNSITIPEGVTLNIPDGIEAKLANGALTNYGTINGTISGAVAIYEGTKTYCSSLSIAMTKAAFRKDTDEVQKITLLEDINKTVSMQNKNIEIDLNGHSMTNKITVGVSGAILSIIDSSESKSGTITSNVVIQEGATFNLPNYLQLNFVSESGTKKTYTVGLKEADYSKYDEMVDLAKEVKESKYTSDSYIELQKVLSDAEIVIGDKTMKANEQHKVDEQTNAIKEALENLVENADSIDPESKEVSLGVILDDNIADMLAGSRSSQLQAKIDKAIEDGYLVSTSIVTEILDPDTASEKDKTDIKKLDKELPSGFEVANYLDLSILVKAGNVNLGKITETISPITFKVAIPEDLIKKNRTFYIYRNHNGVVEEIPTTLDGNIITFESNEFSVYALVFKDKTTKTDLKSDETKTTSSNEDSSSTSETTENTTTNKDKKTKSPKTGDEVMTYVSLLITSVLALGLVKKRKFN